MACELCTIINETYRLIAVTEHSFAIICEQAVKEGHIMVLPKRHVTQNSFGELSPTEAKDFLSLLETMQLTLSSVYEDDILIFKNSNSHSSQPHFHMHLVPSKGNMRRLVSNFENIPTHPIRPKNFFKQVKQTLTKLDNV